MVSFWAMRDTLSGISEWKFISVTAPVAIQRRFLEYAEALALCAPSAGPATLAAAFCRRKQKSEVPPSAADVPDFRPRADLNRPSRPLARPRLSYASTHLIRQFRGRSDMRGCEGRLGSSMCPKLLRIPPPKAGISFFASRMPHRTSPGQPTIFAAEANLHIRTGNHTSVMKQSSISIFFWKNLF